MSTEITVVNDIVEINVQEDVIVIEAPSGAYPLPTGVYSVFGRTGSVVAQEGDYNLTQLGDVTITNPATGQVLRYNGTTWVNSTESYVGTVTSVAMTTPTGLTVTGSPITTAGTLAVGLESGYSIPTDANQALWTTAYNDKINSAAVTGLATKTLTLTQQDGGTITASWDDAEATRLITEVYNETGATLTKGTVVYINGGHGNLPTVTKAIATSDATSAQTYGVVQSDITNNNNGYVVVFGSLTNIDTQAYTDGTQLYLSGTTAGAWTSTKPSAPIHLVYVGIVTRSHPTQGVVEIRIQNGYELEELHDVSAQNPNNGDILQYVTSTGLWTSVAGTTTNISEGTNQYYTNTRARAAISETVTGLDYNNTTGVFSTTTGYGIPTTASQTNWDTAYTNRITSASAPLSIASNAISISQANTTTNGFLSSTDWNTFNNKQAAGNYITALTGEATASGPGSASVTLTNSAVIGKVLTGLNVTGGSVTATDSILAAFGKVQNQINGLIGGSIYQSVWNASTNTPTLASGVGTKGYYYIVNVAGSTNLDGITDWKVGDWAIYDGTAWQKVDNTDAVSSVNGFTGAVSLTTDNISEGSTNLYFTNTRAQNAITLTTTGTSGAATYTSGTLNIPQYQAVLTNPVTGTGTTNTLPKFTGTSAIGNSNITDNGSLITLGSNSFVNGSLGIKTTSLLNYNLRVGGTLTGSTTALGISCDSVVQSDVTTQARGIYSNMGTTAASFTLAGLVHFRAEQGTIGAGSTVTSQIGYWAGAMNGSTNTQGFYGDVTAGANRWNLFMNSTANNYMAGSLGIGSTSLTGFNLRMVKAITGSTGSYGMEISSAVQSDVTSFAVMYNSAPTTQGAAFTLPNLYHYFANNVIAGSGSTVTNQYGFFANSAMTGATNNYGFYGNIPSGTNRWNLYMAGTAYNHLAGRLGIGQTFATSTNLVVNLPITGSTTSNGIFQFGTVQSDSTSAAYGFRNQLNTAAAAFTLATYSHYSSQGGGTVGAGSTITSQIGFWAESTMAAQATNNYGFYGSIPSATNAWNLYMAGTAQNYLAGNTGIGVAAKTTAELSLGAGTTAQAQINLASSTAPTSPQDGDIWFDGSAINVRIAGVTRKIAVV